MNPRHLLQRAPLLLGALILAPSIVFAAGNERIQSFSQAKKILEREIYADHRVTLYCGAKFDERKRVELPTGFMTPKHAARAERVEWEHVVPAENFGRAFPEWREGAPACVDSRGRAYKGRRCAEKASAEFRRMESDLYNLYPAIGAVNAMRSNYRYALLPDVPPTFGSCAMKVARRRAEPPEEARGTIARSVLYMAASCREALYDLNGLPIHVVVIEAFGRNAGWIAASSCLAGTPEVEGPDLILLPEDDFDEDAFLSRVEEVWKAKGKALVVASEGLHHKDGSPIVDPVFQVGRSVYFGDVSSHLSQLITRKLSVKSRSEKPGILSRSSIAWQSGLDRQEAWQCGREGARAALEGKSGFMSVIERLCDEPYSSRVKLVEISPAILEERRLPDTYRKDFGASEAFRTWLSPLVREDELGQFTTFID